MRKTIQAFAFAAFVLAALCAGTVSARQLRDGVKASTTCGGTCSATRPCATAGCVCSFTTPLTAFCTTKLAGAVPAGKQQQ
jgi:hypothetical protein